MMAKLVLCPTCRAPVRVSDEECFKRTWSLVHDRSPGRHTPQAQNNLRAWYKDGRGVKQDHAAAVGWFRKAADQGHASAQYNIGVMYAGGMGVKQDHAEAVRWHRKAADQGHANAQCNRGLMLARGLGVGQDHTEAVQWYRLAADQGHAGALGVAYAGGTGVGQDHAEAVRWYRLAADQGNANAQCNLGITYATGQGTPADLCQAALRRGFRSHEKPRTACPVAAGRTRHAGGRHGPRRQPPVQRPHRHRARARDQARAAGGAAGRRHQAGVHS